MSERMLTMTESEFAEALRARQAQALEEIAAYLDKPRVVWSGSDGVTVAHKEGDLNTLTPLTDWLRSQAAAHGDAATPYMLHCIEGGQIDESATVSHSMHQEGEWFYACEACSGLRDGGLR